MNNMERSRYFGILDQVTTYKDFYDRAGKLSEKQKEHLREIRDMITVFGECAKIWVNKIDKIL